MNGKFPAVAAIVMLSTFSPCQAATPLGSGAIHFTGSVVESACATSPQSNGWRISACPTRNFDVNVQGVEPKSFISSMGYGPVHAKLVNSKVQDRYLDQQYTLVDSTGMPVNTGNYIIILTMP